MPHRRRRLGNDRQETRHGHGEGVGHDSAEKTKLDELHKRKIDLADYVLVVLAAAEERAAL